MTTIKKTFKAIRTLFFSAAIVLTLIQCSEEEIIAEEPITEDIATAITSESADVASISVAGLYTEIKGDVQCSSCTYVVDPSETTVDGQDLGFKPGDVICLKKALKYQALEFVNMEGNETSPIVIGYCAE